MASRRSCLGLLNLAALVALLPSGLGVTHAAAASGTDPTISEFPVPTALSYPVSIAAGPDGNLWFTEEHGNKIGKITTVGAVTEYLIPTSSSTPVGIAAGPDGNLWFTDDGGNQIGKLTTAGVFTEYQVPTSFSNPAEIAAGPDGNLWFPELNGNKIGKITTGGAVTEYAIPTNTSAPSGIAAGPDGNLWFTEYNGNKIAKMTIGGAVTEYQIPTSSSGPDGIAAGPDGNLWFTEFTGNQIGSITTGGAVTEYQIPTNSSAPDGIAAGPDGNLWFTEDGGSKIGSITTGGTVTEYQIPTTPSNPTGIAAGPDGNLWFTEITGNKIGKVTIGGAPPPPPAVPGPPQNLQVTPLNGQADVRWFPPVTNANLVTGYTITAQPVGNDRVPNPIAAPIVQSNSASQLSVLMTGLLADCHQTYDISVRATSTGGDGPAATSSLFRPSGIVAQGQEPPHVVILLDGIDESKPGFTLNPYQPTLDNTPSYCPESVTSSGAEAEADFKGAPNGPWEFFNKWNFADPGGDPTLSCTDGSGNASPAKCSNSTPRDLFTQIPTHSFMLDAIAAQGSVILPYSYLGAILAGTSSNPVFTFHGYSDCASTPWPVPTPPNVPPCFIGDRRSIADDVAALDQEISSIHQVWKNTSIVIVGHSQGGLIASDWWFGGNNSAGTTTNDTGVTNIFTLDSPINGVCATAPCFGPTGYPRYNPEQQRFKRGSNHIRQDAAAGYPVRFVGTFGDSVPLPFFSVNGYGPPGPENLQHELLVTGLRCAAGQDYTADCPPPADHISGCPIVPSSQGWVGDDQHFIVKFCPDSVAYFNGVLSFSY